MLNCQIENVDLLQKGLYAATVRNNVIANNIANVNTPHFKRSDVEFEKILKETLYSRKLRGYITNPKHIPIGPPPVDSVQPQIIQENTTSMRLDENNVDIDVEMSKLAKNQLYYYALVQRVSGELNSIITAVKDGR
ncbi:MAG TPA: flagellar basal body rod protein FlgB [Clostridia bacterium]|nr:flagellar basal body rod protein FlgB [Clostridia bacterium]